MISADKQQYNQLARHFDIQAIPPLLKQYLPQGPLALADFGCGDGPFFFVLQKEGYISREKIVYAVDLQQKRLKRISNRFPFITTVKAPAESVPVIPDKSLDFVISTMVMEHIEDEGKYLDELKRVLKPGGIVYLTTVYKRKWAWYFRHRDGQPVLDGTHVREYTNLQDFQVILLKNNRFASLKELTIESLWFPLLDPILFVAAKKRLLPALPRVIQLLRFIKVPIPGYYTLSAVLEA